MESDKQLKEALAEEQRRSMFQKTRKDGSKFNFGFARVMPEEVDRFHKMELKDLIDEYLGLYYVVYIYQLVSTMDLQYLDLMEREIFGFRSKSAQMEFEKRLKEMIDNHKANMEKCHKMKLKDLIDAYISLANGGSGKDGIGMIPIELEIWDFRSPSEQEEFKKRTQVNPGASSLTKG